jgi:hypothetical protein
MQPSVGQLSNWKEGPIHITCMFLFDRRIGVQCKSMNGEPVLRCTMTAIGSAVPMPGFVENRPVVVNIDKIGMLVFSILVRTGWSRSRVSVLRWPWEL